MAESGRKDNQELPCAVNIAPAILFIWGQINRVLKTINCTNMWETLIHISICIEIKYISIKLIYIAFTAKIARQLKL